MSDFGKDKLRENFCGYPTDFYNWLFTQSAGAVEYTDCFSADG